ncbi:MAG: acrylyl-CoA reductase (NADPH) [Sulfurimonas sp.]|jgi:acrylyl-CoA reductase (NADPH)|uniref:YhdH/YhfP family quinone oxidoreductase n=1 Tax=Sulfurimonas sp. TaxID=2022749 RepID=UPI0039E5A324
MKAYVVNKNENENFESCIEDLSIPIIGKDEVLIKASYSSLNFKDALSSIGNPGVTRTFPHVTGIDVAGVVESSNSANFEVGQHVLVTGYDLGMNSDGGHSEFVKVPASWIVNIPEGLSDKESMIYGTAGLTAALSVEELLANGVTPKQGQVLVTGATGGVGSIAVAILSKLGFDVIALSGKEEKIPFLKSIGAKEVILRDTFDVDNKKPMLKPRFSAVIDTVGGKILAHALKETKYDGVVTCCGLNASYELNTSVFPFILRGIRLIGIDSVEIALQKKEAAWKKIANEFKIPMLETLCNEITLEEIKTAYDILLSGKSVGRYLVKI